MTSRVWLVSLLGTLMVAAFGCGAKPGGDDSGASSGDGQRTYRVAVIPKGTTHEFWKAVHAGAVKARRELADRGIDVEVIWQGSLREDDRDQQIQVVENFVTRRIDGMVLAPLDSQALVRPVKTAQAAGIPVVIIDSGLNMDDYVSFVATDNEKGGYLAAERLGALLGGQGKAILFRYAVGSASTEARENGFLRGLKEKFPEIEVISQDQYAGATREDAYKVSQALLNRFGEEVDGIFCVNESCTFGMAKALRDIGKAGGAVKIVGFDTGAQSVVDLKNNDLQGLVVQDPVKMGYLGVLTAIDHARGQSVEKRIDTGVTVVTPENMEEEAHQRLLHPPIDRYLDG